MRGSQQLGDGGCRSGGKGGAWRNSNTEFATREAEKELEKLDAAFSLLGGQVRAQKEAAQKWIRRQRIRMEVYTTAAFTSAQCLSTSLVNGRFDGVSKVGDVCSAWYL